MWRSLIIFAGFALISAPIRGLFSDAYKTIDQLIQNHTVASYVVTGILGFGSFLAVRLTARD